MAARPALARETLALSQWSPRGSQSSDATTSTGRTTPPKPTECLQTDIKADIETITAYLVKERAPKAVQAAIGRISDAYKRRVEQKNTEQAIRQLQAVVQKLADKVDNKPYRPTRLNIGSYTAAARQGLPTQTRGWQSLNAGHVTLEKPVPARYKREIVVVQSTETTEQKRRTYKELLEQLNRAGVAGAAVAIRQLGSGDMILTIEDEQACTSWLADTKWLETFGARARVKRQEFAVMAYGIRVNQIQGQT
jgi:hypothetical protein